MTDPRAGDGDGFAVPLDDLEASVRVRAEDQSTTQPEPPGEGPLAPEELDRQRLLGISGAGRLRLP